MPSIAIIRSFETYVLQPPTSPDFSLPCQPTLRLEDAGRDADNSGYKARAVHDQLPQYHVRKRDR